MRVLSANADNQTRIVEEGGLGGLIDLLKSDNKDVQEHACGALRNLSMKREVSRKIGEEGALPYMIGLLRSPDERIQEQVLYLLFT